jgi:hypothetical protein
LAVIGGLDGCRLLYNRVNARPEVLLSARPGIINYLTDDTIDEPLAITNRIPVEQHVEVVGALFKKNDIRLAIPVTFNPTTIRELTENQTELIRFRTTATDPGAYCILAQLKIRAGWFGSRNMEFPINVAVWSPRPRKEGLHISRRDATACQLEGDLLVGTPATEGVTCRIRIARHPEVNRVYVTGLNASTVSREEWSIHGEEGAALGSALFRTPPFPGFKRQHFHVELESTRPTDWDQILANTEIFFDLQTKETPCPTTPRA